MRNKENAEKFIKKILNEKRQSILKNNLAMGISNYKIDRRVAIRHDSR